VNATTKSGTNSVYGTGYEFLPQRWLDSKNYFEIRLTKIPEFRRNQFGASRGGRFIKNKTFIFGELRRICAKIGIKQKLPQFLPPALAANADPKVAPYLPHFSRSNGTLGGKQVLHQ